MNAQAHSTIEPTSSARFIDNGDGTVSEPARGLMWSRETLSARCVSHKKAETICADLALAGHSDWRLPTFDELAGLVDRARYAPAIDVEAFPDTKNDWYWTSTIAAWSSGFAGIVHFFYGGACSGLRSNGGGFVRAVRSVPAGQ